MKKSIATACLCLGFQALAAAGVFNVVNSGLSDYVINGVADPTLTLYRGRTYTFNINASGHPFWIKTNAVTGTGSAYNDGVTGNGTSVGTLTFTVPTNAPSVLFYICQFHATMQGTLNIADSPQFGWWRFETIGSNLLDSSGRNLHGLITSQNPGPNNGVSGYATDVPGEIVIDGGLSNANLYSFRFSKDLLPIIITNIAPFRLTNNPASFTVEAFIKPTSAKWPMRIVDILRTGLPGPPPRTLISPFLGDLGPAPLMALSVHSDQTTNYVTQYAPPIVPSPIALGHWHHIAFIVQTNKILFYVDYQLLGEATYADYAPGTFTNINTGSLGGIISDPFNTFEGFMDEIRVTAAALSPAQFLQVVGGLKPGFRAMSVDGLGARLTLVTESGVTYRVQSTTNLTPSTPPTVWSNVGNVFTGLTFYTTVTNTGGSPLFFRAIRNP